MKDSIDFLLLDFGIQNAAKAEVVIACRAKKQAEIRRKLHSFVVKYPNYTIALGYFVERMSEIYNSSHMAHLAMEQTFFFTGRSLY